MKLIKVAAALGALGLSLALLPAPALAATAHNSQAGANGHNKNVAAPTGRHMRMMGMSRRHMRRM